MVQVNNLGLALGAKFKFYTIVTKGLKLKVRKFWGLIPTFVEVTGEKGGQGGLPPIPNRFKVILHLAEFLLYARQILSMLIEMLKKHFLKYT